MGGPCLACFSCFLVVLDDHNQPLKSARTSFILDKWKATATHTTINCHHYQFLGDSVKLSSHCLAFLGRESATKCEKVAVVISPERRHFVVCH